MFARMCTNIDLLMNQPYHNNNINDHIVNNDTNSQLLDPAWITSPELLGCCIIPVEISHCFHMNAEAAGIGWGAQGGTDPKRSKVKMTTIKGSVFIQTMSTRQNVGVISNLYGITHLDVVSETQKYTLK